jgi:hypothetical protein
MKFLFGLLTGILISTMFFIWYAKNKLLINNNTPTEQVVTAISPANDSDFMAFYDRFHQDSLFQLAHISFPLEGIPRVDSLGNYPADFRWQQENWIMHHPIINNDGEFVQEFVPISENIIVENIRDAQGFFSMQRRFAKLGEEWRLIYYAAMNPTREDDTQ